MPRRKAEAKPAEPAAEPPAPSEPIPEIEEAWADYEHPEMLLPLGDGDDVPPPDYDDWDLSDEELDAWLAEPSTAEAPAVSLDQEVQLVSEVEGHAEFGAELGDAEFVGQYKDGSPEWHEARTKGIGGSDAASILGIGFKSAYTLWMEKKGHWEPLPVDDRGEEIFLWGHLHEYALQQRFLMAHPEFKWYEGGSWRKKDAQWMLANPDGILVNQETGEMCIVECKSSEQGTGWEYDRCPAKYVVQIRHYLWVFGLKYGYLIVKIGNSDYREFLVPADPNEPIEKLRGGTVKPSKFKIEYGEGSYLQMAERNFLDLTEPPPMDGNKDIYEHLRQSNMSLERGVEVVLPVDVATALLEAQAAYAAAEEALQEARNHVMAHMGTAQYATYNDHRVASRVAKGKAAPYLKLG